MASVAAAAGYVTAPIIGPSDPTKPGLTSVAAQALLRELGPNSITAMGEKPIARALRQLWSPVPWMLELVILLQFALGDVREALIILLLLLFNAGLGLLQEGPAQATLMALRARLALTASVRRDGIWAIAPAASLVPGDIVKISLGAVVPADMRLCSGAVLLDQSMLTGESLPVEAEQGWQTYAGALVRRGEAVAEVTATGMRSKFGRTAELLRDAHIVSAQQKTVLQVVLFLAAFNGAILLLLVAYAFHLRMALGAIIPLILTAILGSIPVALPATFSLAAALGARALAARGVLLTRLSAVNEAASIDVLCADKTGTLTCNQLTVQSVLSLCTLDAAHILQLAALASSEGGQDPVDQAIRAASRPGGAELPKLVKFLPFDPATKMSEASTIDPAGRPQRIVKGAFAAVSALAVADPAAQRSAADLEAKGFRLLALASGTEQALSLIGLIALSDPPRADSAALVGDLHDLGISTIMVTGDAPATAAIVAQAVGITGALFPSGAIPETLSPQQFSVFAGVLPEDKFKLVKALQRSGHSVGMCGDGANDAPALRQAQIGIAVLSATDIAKSAAGMVLTAPGLTGIIDAVKEGRRIFQRILTYTLNAITGKVVKVLFLAVGLVMTGQAVLTPLLMVIIMITGDFLGMSLTTDNVVASENPNVWQIGRLSIAGIFVGFCELIFCSLVLAAGVYFLRLDIDSLRSLSFIAMVFGNQATTYNNRARHHLWSSRPSNWLVLSSILDMTIATSLAVSGIAMARLPLPLIGATLAGALLFALALDLAKRPLFVRLSIG